MPTYGPASTKVQTLIDDLISDYYPELVETAARVRPIFAYPIRNKFGMARGPAVSQYGVGCLAKVKVNGEADRVDGKGDATITIDQPTWENLAEEERIALIDRMLYALRVKKRKGIIRTDDRGRPLLGVAKPDWFLSGYQRMAERHKQHSVEVIQARQFHDDWGNLLFSFAEDLAVEVQKTLPRVEKPKPRQRRGAASVAAANR